MADFANASLKARRIGGRRLTIQTLDTLLEQPEAQKLLRAHFLDQLASDPTRFLKEVVIPLTPSSMIEDTADASAEEKAREIQQALKSMQDATAKLQTLAPDMARQAAEGASQSSSAPGGTPEWKTPEGGPST